MPENPMDAFFKAGQQVLDEVNAQAAEANAGGDEGADAGAEGDKGQKPDSPTGTDAEAGKKESDPAADAKKDEPTDDGTKKPDGAEGDEDFIEKDGKKYYRSFDKHPEWSELRQAQETLNQILENNEYSSMDELTADLKTGKSLVELIGTTDAEAVQGILKDAQDMQVTREYWAEQEAKKQEEGETSEETIDRLKREKQEILDAQNKDKARKEELARHETAVTEFNTEIERGVDKVEGLDDTTKGMLKMFLGIGNPLEQVDVFDKNAVRGALKESIGKFGEYLKAVQDAAIQGYVEGKKDGPKIPAATDTEPVKVVKKKELPENATMEERFSAANEELIEVLTSATKPAPTE